VLFHSLSTGACGQISARKAQNLASAGLAFHREAVARQGLATDNLAQFEGEAPEW
jgi:hypothetical protein